MSIYDEQLSKIRDSKGFIAALDQSGGSSPRALARYGIPESAYANDEEMFALIHELRYRIITSPVFGGDRIIGAILFEDTMRRDIDGTLTAEYLWQEKSIVPFLKIDKGLEEAENGVQLLKPMPNLDALLDEAKTHNIFGTKMRSLIKKADPAGIRSIVAQQFEVGQDILAKGLMPIIEPEVSIDAMDKAEAERLLLLELEKALDALGDDQQVMLKLTLPVQPNFYQSLIDHPKVLKLVALSGGYAYDEATQRLSENNGMVASFSRALTEKLHADQSPEAFNEMFDMLIQRTYEASLT